MAAPPDQNVVIVTSSQMFQQLQTVVIGQSRMEGKLDAIGQAQVDTRTDHETRLRALERGRWPLPAVAALCGVGGLVASLMALFGKG